MGITLREIGRRLKEVRNYFNLTQSQIADELGLTQNNVSRLETGRELGSEKLILFLAYYSKYINIDAIFDERFDMFSDETVKFSKHLHLDTIVAEKIRMMDKARKAFNQQMDVEIENLIVIAEKQIK